MDDFNAYHGMPRLSCTGGHREFFINSNGDISRCASYFYNHGGMLMGNIMNDDMRDRIRSSKESTYVCPHGTCISECDAHHTSQIIMSKDGRLVKHTAERAIAKGLVGKDHCILQTSLTAICNYKCSYCCADKTMKDYAGQDMDSGKWADVARFFVSTFPSGNASILGGEPTVHPGLVDHVSILIQGGWHVDIFTNFSLPERVRQVVEKTGGDRLFLIISVHPTQRGFSMDKIIDGVKSLADSGLRYGYSFVLTEENKKMDDDLGILRRLKDDTNPEWISSIRNVYETLA